MPTEPEPDGETVARPSSTVGRLVRDGLTSSQKIAAFITLLWAAAAAGLVFVAGHDRWLTSEEWPMWLAAPLLVLLFGLAEVFVVQNASA